MSDRTRIDRVVEGALACASGEREAFLDAACDGDITLRREVESLLAQASRADSFLEEPAAAPSLIGRSLGPYRIVASIGAGGMGEVYRARDTKLERDVAIKILPSFSAQDPDRLARQSREARALAALNHPHIGAIYGLEEAEGIRVLVLELVDGETLADRIARGPLTIGEAVRIAGQIAQALAAAHAKGIVHRDLKPANVKVTSAGSVKVLDFGLAKAAVEESGAATLTTRVGTVMGTPAYMSPEQARAEAVDQQTDIWAFGCVLYEMLTARRAFAGRTASDSIAAVLNVDPDGTALPAATPVAVRTLLARCLEKDRARRLHSIIDAQIDLEGALDSAKPALTFMPPAGAQGSHRPAWQKWVLAAALGLALGSASYEYGQSAAVSPAIATYNVDIDLPEGLTPWAGLAMSPDGRALAASVTSPPTNADGDVQLIIRYFDQLNGWQSVKGGEDGEYPFWSPDSKHLAFFSGGRLMRMDPPSGVPVVVCAALDGRGGAWLDDGTIVFAERWGPLKRVDATGASAPVAFVLLDEGQESVRFPSLAGPRRLMYLAGYADSTRSELRSVDLDAPGSFTTVMKAARSGVYGRGYLFFERDGLIVGQRFDPSANLLHGEPIRITSDGLPSSGHLGYLALSTAEGHVTVAPVQQPLRQLVWMTREGRLLGELGGAFDQGWPDLSPDGTRLAIARRLPGQRDKSIWVVDTQSSLSRQLSTGSNEFSPVWAPDGQRLAFASTSGLNHTLYAANVEGSRTLTPVVERETIATALGWTKDGRIVWATTADIEGPRSLGSPGIFLSAGGSRTSEPPIPFRSGTLSNDGRLSPDGKYIAYRYLEAGQGEVYVDTFPVPAARPERISRAGGRFPRWRRDSRELYFMAGNEIMAVKVSPGARRPFGVPTSLFKLPATSGYVVSPDGSKFLVLVPRPSHSNSFKLTLNWFASQADRSSR